MHLTFWLKEGPKASGPTRTTATQGADNDHGLLSLCFVPNALDVSSMRTQPRSAHGCWLKQHEAHVTGRLRLSVRGLRKPRSGLLTWEELGGMGEAGEFSLSIIFVAVTITNFYLYRKV